MPQTLVRSIATLVLLTVFFNSSIIACGPFSTESIFVFTVHPAFPLERYARGEIGVIQPSYARSYLYVAYRHLANSPFTPEEQKALTELWNDRLNNSFDLGDQEWLKAWTDARSKVAGVAITPKIEVYRSREKPNEYETYLNCQKDSFATSISTLNERIKKYGADSEVVRTWVQGQDEVFANCGEGRHIPSQLPVDADALARADRAYQIAAANFYSSSFEEAQKYFEAIASDSSSPWQPTAPYLLARTFLRKASLGATETKKESLSQAETQLQKVLADKNLTSTHDASARLLNLVRLRLRPAERLADLARVLVAKTNNDRLKQDLWDYTILLDQALETEEPATSPIPVAALRADDLSDWISTLEQSAPENAQHALTRWLATRTTPWLVAALSKLDGKHERASELVAEALKVKSSSAAFASTRFHAVRLMIESGKTNEARALLDQLLKSNRNQLDASSLNLLLSQRMMLATNLTDFLSHGPRIPAALSWNDDGREIPTDPGEILDETRTAADKPLFDHEAARVINAQLPLALLKEAVANEALPTHLRQDLAQAAWLRAVLLGDNKTADELVPMLKNLAPSLSSHLDSFLKTTKPDAKKFTALYIWLKFPGLEPIVDTGIGRGLALNEQDSYRDNWWCSAAYQTQTPDDDDDGAQSFTSSGLKAPIFLTASQLAIATRETATLNSLGPAPNYLSRQVIQWATKNPTDPRVPEALHRAVHSTRYGCTDKETGRWSKAAFDLLHRKYPNTTWAKKTKYWFKE